jgi:hypothetical protein
MYKHTLKEIVSGGTIAKLSYICNGKVYYEIDVNGTGYQLELNSTDEDWRNEHMQLEYKAIALMRWIRKSINDESLIQLSE